MNILYVTLSPFPHLGGKSTTMLSEAEGIAARHQVRIICARPGEDLGKGDCQKTDSTPLTYVDSERSLSLLRRILTPIRMARAIRRLAKTYRVDVVSSHDLYGAIASILAGLRESCLLTLHSTYSMDPFVMEESVTGLSSHRKVILKIRLIVDSLLEVLCYNLIRGIICVSEYEQQDAMRKTLCKTKIFLVRNAIDTNMMLTAPEKRKELRAGLHLLDDELIFLFAGRMVPKNGPFTIARAIPDVVSSCGNSRFIFVGEGPEKARCEDYVGRAKLMQVVHFLGARNAVEILPVADVFVSHVSSLVKGIGLTVIEALANGLPVIAGEDQITAKILKCGQEIVCVRKDDPRALAECMISLAKNPQRRRVLSIAGRQRVIEDFSLKSRTNSVETLYRLIAAN